MVNISLARSFQGSNSQRRNVAAKLYAERTEARTAARHTQRPVEHKWAVYGDGSLTYSVGHGGENFRVMERYPAGTIQRFAWCGFIGVAIKNLYRLGNGSLDAALDRIARLGDGNLEGGIEALMYLAKQSGTDIDSVMRAIANVDGYRR